MNRDSADIVTIVGARPQFIKAAVVSKRLQKLTIDEAIIHTGQHFEKEMSQSFFEELNLSEPLQNLGLHGLKPGDFHARAVDMLSASLSRLKPKLTLVYGDTDSTLAGAIAAIKSKVPLAHVEAGLRSGNRQMAEEQNRIITDAVSDIAYCPTKDAACQLENEQYQGRIVFSGDVMLDAVHQSGIKAGQSNRKSPYILATIHRAENVDDADILSDIFQALGSLNLDVILPLHPRTKQNIGKFSIVVPDNINLISPLGYRQMIAHITDAILVATDSGGVQKEAYFCNTPSVVLRNETEWNELTEIGASKIAGTSQETIVKCIKEALSRGTKKRTADEKPFGDGNAGKIIAEDIAQFIAN